MQKVLSILTLLFYFSTTHAYMDITDFTSQGLFLHGWTFAHCPEHLLKDPEGCSSWVIVKKDGERDCVLEKGTDFYLYPLMYVDHKLTERLGNDIYLLPQIKPYGCDHATCSKCGEQVRLRSGMEILSDVEGYAICGSGKCGCLDEFINAVDDEELFDEMIENYWHFCGKPSISSEYFDESFATKNFDRLCKQIAYVKENPSCKCFWSESQGLMQEIIEYVYSNFRDNFNTSLFMYLQKKKEAVAYETLKEILYGDRKLGEHLCFCFSYADIEESLNEFDPTVYNRFYHNIMITKENYENWKNRILKEVREDYLALCKKCYKKHPHPRVAKEIEELLALEENPMDDVRTDNVGRAFPSHFQYKAFPHKLERLKE